MKTATQVTQSSRHNIQGDYSSSTAHDCAILLRHLQEVGSFTTIQARNELGVMHPGGRVQNLRDAGYNIKLVWTKEPDPTGRLHRVGRYILSTEEAQQ